MNCLRKSLLRMVLVGVACGSYLLTALPAGADVKVYIANFNARTVTVINSGTNTVVNNIAVPHATLGIAPRQTVSSFTRRNHSTTLST
jgi:YVTN family beta-propeller protein